jgi:hypothetical protein
MCCAVPQVAIKQLMIENATGGTFEKELKAFQVCACDLLAWCCTRHVTAIMRAANRTKLP